MLTAFLVIWCIQFAMIVMFKKIKVECLDAAVSPFSCKDIDRALPTYRYRK